MHRFTWRLQNVVFPKSVILTNGFSPTCASALIQGSYIVAHFAKLRNAQLMKTERSEGHHEAVKALALSELGGVGDYPDLEFGHAGLVLSGQQ